ncbi:MAG: hypothetical protein WC058_09570 [Phycisphaeraceae bacterium]
MKLHVYLDTTVISAADDLRTPERQTQTLVFLARSGEFEFATSELTRQELAATPDAQRRDRLLARIASIPCIGITAPMHTLAKEYVEHDIIPAAYEDDAIHIAAAVLSGQDILASWNFRHMVNRRRRAMVNLLNASRNLPAIEILTPPEL